MKFFLIFNLLLFANFSYARKVIKVKGSKVVFSKRGVSSSFVGKKVRVFADGYEVGVIKVITLKGKYGIGRIVEGAIGRGDVLKVKSSRKKRKKDSKGSSSSSKTASVNFKKYLPYVGLGYYSYSDLSGAEDGSTLTFSSGMVLSFGLDWKFGDNFGLYPNLNYSLGGTAEAPALAFSDFDFSYWELNLDVYYDVNDRYFVKLGFGFNFLGYTGEADGGSFNDSYMGYSWGIGGGLRYPLSKKIVLRVEANYRSITYFSADLDNPGGKQSGDPGFSSGHLNLTGLIGYKF
jgi:hypothetical protein